VFFCVPFFVRTHVWTEYTIVEHLSLSIYLSLFTVCPREGVALSVKGVGGVDVDFPFVVVDRWWFLVSMYDSWVRTRGVVYGMYVCMYG